MHFLHLTGGYGYEIYLAYVNHKARDALRQGGMKAVIWTDAVQLFFMFAGILAIFISGILKIGGFDSLYSALERGERYTMFR